MSKLLLALSFLSLHRDPHHGCLALMPPMPVTTPSILRSTPARTTKTTTSTTLGNRENAMTNGVQIFLAKNEDQPNDDDFMAFLKEGRNKILAGKSRRATDYAQAAAIQSAITSATANTYAAPANVISIVVPLASLVFVNWRIDEMRKEDRIARKEDRIERKEDRKEDLIFALSMQGASRDNDQTLLLGKLQFEIKEKDGEFGHRDQNPADLIKIYEETTKQEGARSPLGKYLTKKVFVMKKAEFVAKKKKVDEDKKKKANEAKQKKADDAKQKKASKVSA